MRELTTNQEWAILIALNLAAQEYEKDAATFPDGHKMRKLFTVQAKEARELQRKIEENGLSFTESSDE